MKLIKLVLASISIMFASFAPLLITGVAHASVNVVVQCSPNQELVSVDERQVCDLSIDKQVSVNGGGYVEADTSGAAALAQLGDTVKWKITVTNNSTPGLKPHGVVYVKDVIPGKVTYNSYSASAGIYKGNDGSLFENSWILPLTNSDNNTNLPATLILVTKASGVGLVQNTAAFFKYDPGSCDGGCAYVDGDATNNSNDAWVRIQPKPQVLAASTLATTGTGLQTSLIAGLFLVATVAVVGYGRLYRKPTHYKS